MKALVIGATGATGKKLVQNLLKDDDYREVHIFARNPVAFSHEKLTVHCIDFNRPEQWKHNVCGEVLFSCLGTTLKTAGSKAQQRKVDFDYQFHFAQAAKSNHVNHYVLVSSYGADARSSFFYPRMKGELEEAVVKLDFNQTTIFRPGMLERENSDRPAEVWGVKISKLFLRWGRLKAYRPLPVEQLAKAMINRSKQNQKGTAVVSLDEILPLATAETSSY
ncbi:NAD(P)H-binding protein [Bergeyella sp. RCAD1439]|uniref:NAD(P)H-binding protein n=1 Tax=Bergeyella anatis TaxID=3113737 RepID=UPI002E19838E|nr:NAD(P)H-binding protein [Bergeyella sp. RCAD1439]